MLELGWSHLILTIGFLSWVIYLIVQQNRWEQKAKYYGVELKAYKFINELHKWLLEYLNSAPELAEFTIVTPPLEPRLLYQDTKKLLLLDSAGNHVITMALSWDGWGSYNLNIYCACSEDSARAKKKLFKNHHFGESIEKMEIKEVQENIIAGTENYLRYLSALAA